MPLIGQWLGSMIVYLFYLFGIISSIYLFYISKISVNKIDLPFMIFIILALFSSIYSVSGNLTTELFFLPLLVFLYLGAKGIIKNDNLSYLVYGIIFVFLIFSIYLLFQLPNVSFNYAAYYHYSNASNKVEYLTMSMYASIILIYAIFVIKNKYIRYPIIIYTFFLITISGARFSIFFLAVLLFSLFMYNLKSLKFIIFIILLFLLFIFNLDFILSLDYIKDISKFFDFAINRLSHFDSNNASLQGRFYAIENSLIAINDSVVFGYGLHCSPDIIKFVYPHNMFLEVWLDSGIFGFISLLLLSASTFYCIYQIPKNDKNLFLMFSFFYLFLSQLKSFSIYHSPLYFVFISFIFTVYIKNKEELNE